MRNAEWNCGGASPTFVSALVPAGDTAGRREKLQSAWVILIAENRWLVVVGMVIW